MSEHLLKYQQAAKKAVATRRLKQAAKEERMEMNIYKVKFGMSAGSVDNTWLVRAPDFSKASAKAIKTAARWEETYTSFRQIVSLELVGEEEN